MSFRRQLRKSSRGETGRETGEVIEKFLKERQSSTTVAEPKQPNLPWRPGKLTGVMTFLLVGGSAAFVFWQLQPDLLFTDSTTSGGDLGAHVWGPQFLRENLWSWGRLTGWAPDWYAGFPAFHFYMVVPYLLVVLLSYVIKATIAFKLISVLGAVALPVCAWAGTRMMGFRFPVPALCAWATLLFLFQDFEPTRIWGGTLPSLLAGEFAYSISLALVLLIVGIAAKGMKEGGLRTTGAVVLALVGLCHIVPAFFALGSLVILALVSENRKRALRWLAIVVPWAGLLGAFWALPFWWRRDYFNNMGWEKNEDYLEILLLDGWWWVIVAAAAGVAVTIAYRIRFGWFLIASTILWACAYRVAPDGVLLNGRLAPFYHLSLCLLAGLGIGVLLWRLCGLDTGGFFVSRHQGMRNPAPRSPMFRFTRSVMLAKLRRAVTFPNIVYSLLGLGLVVVVLDSVSGSSLAELGFKQLSDAPGEAERLAQQLQNFSQLLLLGVGIVSGVEILRRVLFLYRLSTQHKQRWLVSMVFAVALVMLAVLAIPLRALGPLGETEIREESIVQEDGSVSRQSAQYYALSLPLLPRIGDYKGTGNVVPYWARWNFSGYEDKVGYEGYQALITQMKDIGDQYGCGRAMWEYDKDVLQSYGTPMALMLLPSFSGGCIGSMEGLYFESSATVPYHFLNQSELSVGPSRAMRDIPYRSFNIEQGIGHMQLLGVRYYMAVTPVAKEAAKEHSELELIGESGDWDIFLIADSETVSALEYEPVVWEGIGEGQPSWLEPSTRFYNSDDFSVLPAASGPAEWERISVDLPLADAPRKHLEPVQVSNIQMEGGNISFSVDTVGVPVLVKTSYFPNWQVSGAAGPWRVSPNLMVVIPTENDVQLRYGWTPIDALAYALTGVGIALMVVFVWYPRATKLWQRRRQPTSANR